MRGSQMIDQGVKDQVLEAAQMVATEGLGEGRPARGFFIIVGNSEEILAPKPDNPEKRDIKRCNCGDFNIYLDRRSQDLKIGDCLGERKRNFWNLLYEDGAVVVDGQSGQVCCGGFFVNDSTSGIDIGGARTKAASAMATQANGCYVVLASEAFCGSTQKSVPQHAVLKVFDGEREPEEIPLRVSATRRESYFDNWLCPLEFGADLRTYSMDFVQGTRQWVLDALEDWRRDTNGLRCRVLLAGPGFGKTAIAARFYEMTTRVLAIHLCRHNDSSKRDPRRMIASIAYRIAEELPQFRDALRKVREAEHGGTAEAYALRPTARELADCLLIQPLCKIDPPEPVGSGGRYAIIIDALDEAEHDSKKDLLDLVALDFRKLPPWIAVLVTARPEVVITRKLERLRPIVLDAEHYKENCNTDVSDYLHRILAPRFKDEGSLLRAIDSIATKSNGLFLYLHYIRDMLAHGGDIDALPIGLPGVYQEQLELVLGGDGLGDENSEVRRVVEVIIAAQDPVHVTDELPDFSGVPNDSVLNIVTRLSRLLSFSGSQRRNRVYVFHKSFVDWLTGDGVDRTLDEPKFIVDRRAAHRRLASSCGVSLMRLLSEEGDRFESDMNVVNVLERFLGDRGRIVGDAQQPPNVDKYSLRWSVRHLVEAGDLDDVSLALLHSVRFLTERATQIDTLIADAALLLPKTTLLHRALILARNHVRLWGAQWLAENLWQRLLSPAEAHGVDDLERLARDARIKARTDLMFSGQRACLTPADSPLQWVLEGHSQSVNGVTSFADAKGNKWLASCSDDEAVHIWDPIKGGNAVRVLEGHCKGVNGLTAFVDTKNHAWVASCSDDKTVRIWDPINGGRAVQVLEGHSSYVNGVTTFVDAKKNPLVVSCSDDETVRIWDPIRGGESLHVLTGHSDLVNDVTVFVDSEDRTLVASCSDDKTVRIWDPIKGGEALHVLKGHSRRVNGVTAFTDAKRHTWVASCSRDKTVRIWDPIEGGKAVYVLNGHSRSVNRVTTFLSDKGDKWVASCSEDGTVCIWNPIVGGEAVHVLKGHSDHVVDVTAFVDTEGHTWVASCSEDATVCIWDPINGGDAVRVLEGHSRNVKGVTAFVGATGQWCVASFSRDKTVCIWDPTKGLRSCPLSRRPFT